MGKPESINLLVNPFATLHEQLEAMTALAGVIRDEGERSDNSTMAGYGTLLDNTVDAMGRELDAFEALREDPRTASLMREIH